VLAGCTLRSSSAGQRQELGPARRAGAWSGGVVPGAQPVLVSRIWALMRRRPAGNSAARWWRSRVTAPGGVRIVTLAGCCAGWP